MCEWDVIDSHNICASKYSHVRVLVHTSKYSYRPTLPIATPVVAFWHTVASRRRFFTHWSQSCLWQCSFASGWTKTRPLSCAARRDSRTTQATGTRTAGRVLLPGKTSSRLWGKLKCHWPTYLVLYPFFDSKFLISLSRNIWLLDPAAALFLISTVDNSTKKWKAENYLRWREVLSNWGWGVRK